jgi:hypothetical protein
MADVGPKIEVKAFRDDFVSAKSDDPRLRCPLVLARDHLFRISCAARHLIARAIMA